MSTDGLEALTTVRRLTPAAASAIATIEINGPQAATILNQALVGMSGRTISLNQPQAKFARWRFTDPQFADEHVVVLVRDTGSIEVHCHGGLAITEQIMRQLQIAGCVLASDQTGDSQLGNERGERTAIPEPFSAVSQASIEAEARHWLMRASTLKASLVLLDQLQGALARDIEQLRHWQATDRHQEALQLCNVLIKRAQFGTKLLNPWRLTLAGPPNVGKSSLMNALTGSTRVLVHHEPGTTRDAVETSLVMGGWPLILTDTAGIRQSQETIEQHGVQTAWHRWQNADVGLLVVDATVGWTEQHNQLLAGPETLFVVINKVDAVTETYVPQLAAAIQLAMHRPCQTIVSSSTKTSEGVNAIVQAISNHLNSIQPPRKCGVPFTAEQVQWLEAFRDELRIHP